MEKDRADKIMVLCGLAQTRSKAAQMIERKEVFYNGKVVKKPSLIVNASGLTTTTEISYVGRGAYKLVHAIDKFSLMFEDKVIADVGASTGGFTQVSLLNGASKVFALDVGHGQLDPILKDDERVINLEGTNIREFSGLGELVDVVVVDLSFISLELVLEDIFKLLKDRGEAVFLVKPQFELEKKALGKKGIVKDPEHRLKALEKIFDISFPQKIIHSPIEGKEGNIEFLFYCIKGLKETSITRLDLEKLALEKR